MSKSDAENETYKDSATIIKPRYSMFISDANQTIYVNYVSPLNDKYIEKVDYTFTWSTDLTTNIVTAWNPDVDLKQYLIQRASRARINSQNLSTYDDMLEMANDYENNVKFNPETMVEGSGGRVYMKEEYGGADVSAFFNYDGPNETDREYLRNEAIEGYKEAADEISSEVYEMYDAELETIGIPADPVLLAEVKIVPRILESVSRTAGYYIIQGCTDEIDNRGRYTSTLKLFRMKNL